MDPSPACPADETLGAPCPTASTHRIDSAHPPQPVGGIAEPVERLQRVGQATLGIRGGGPNTSWVAYPQPKESSSGEASSLSREYDLSALRSSHAEDLLNHVQRLSEELDARSAKLHADIAIHERRERAFRLWAQQRAQEIRCQQDACSQQQARLQAQARRMAMIGGITPD